MLYMLVSQLLPLILFLLSNKYGVKHGEKIVGSAQCQRLLSIVLVATEEIPQSRQQATLGWLLCCVCKDNFCEPFTVCYKA